jgi:hypothetical protein
VSPEVKEIPPLPFAYYDPWLTSYQVVHSRAVPLTVEAVKTVGGRDAVRAGGPDASPAPPRAEKAAPALVEQAGIGANHLTMGRARRALDPRAEILSFPFLATLAAPPAVFAAILLLRRAARRDPARERREKALVRARAELRAPGLDPGGVARAFQDYFRGRLGLPPGELTPADLAAALARAGAPEAPRAACASLLERLLAGRFGLRDESAEALAAEAARALEEVDRCTRG